MSRKRKGKRCQQGVCHGKGLVECLTSAFIEVQQSFPIFSCFRVASSQPVTVFWHGPTPRKLTSLRIRAGQVLTVRHFVEGCSQAVFGDVGWDGRSVHTSHANL